MYMCVYVCVSIYLYLYILLFLYITSYTFIDCSNNIINISRFVFVIVIIIVNIIIVTIIFIIIMFFYSFRTGSSECRDIPLGRAATSSQRPRGCFHLIFLRLS